MRTEIQHTTHFDCTSFPQFPNCERATQVSSLFERLSSYAQFGLLTPGDVIQRGLATLTSSTPGDLTYQQLDKNGWETNSEKFKSVRGYLLRREGENFEDIFSLDWNAFYSIAIEKPYDTPRMIADRRAPEIEALCRHTALFLVSHDSVEILPQAIGVRLEEAVLGSIPSSKIAFILVHHSLEQFAREAFRGSLTEVVGVSDAILPRVPTYSKDKTICVPSYRVAAERILAESGKGYFAHIARLPLEDNK